MSKKLIFVLSLVLVAAFALAACATPETETIIETVIVEQPGETTVETIIETVEVVEEVVVTQEVIVEVMVTPEPTMRKGGWLDTIVFVADPSVESAVTRLLAGDLDVYAQSSSNAETFQTIVENGLGYVNSYGSYNELTFNTAGPIFANSGTFNPFAIREVREATNWLLDRDYLVQEIMGGLAIPKFFPITSGFPDYARYVDVVRELEAKYAYNPEAAADIITTAMTANGAELVDGIWSYEGEPITVIILIRIEDERRQIGDYIGQQLETVGFQVDYQYKTSSEASVLWVRGDVNDGLWHLYTGGWITTAIDRDQGGNFEFFYSPRSGYGFTSLWSNYLLPDDILDLYTQLANNDFNTLDERRELFSLALETGIFHSNRVWLVDRLSYSPYAANVEVAADLAGGIAGAQLWGWTLRFAGQEGGELTLAMADMLTDPWNPVAGSNWIYDSAQQRAIQDWGVMTDPYTGLSLPQRIESATVTVQEGLPVGKTLDWVELEFAPEIAVPEDAWVDWDAENQVWITVGEKFPEGLTAKLKSVVTYPADLFETVKWHDGSSISVADFVMALIVPFDVAKEASPIYDEVQVGSLESFLSAFKGYRIASTDPLVVEYYSDSFTFDAENNVATLWPNYAYGTAAWHNLAVGWLADAAGELAFSADKADAAEIEWMNYLSGPSIEILKAKLDQAQAEGFIPYEPTLGQYLTAEEVIERYENLESWYSRLGHFWVGTGPYYVNRVFPVEKTMTLSRFQDYPDSANKWGGFGVAPIAVVEMDGPGRVTIGEEAVFDVFVTFDGAPYAADDILETKYLLFDATGALVAVGVAELVEDGYYTVTIDAETSGALAEGANKIEVAVVSKLVSLPFKILT
jgi:peptide/nickel transport system substrate-binding protein